jgi:hypothetical protein
MCISRFDAETKETFLDLYTKVDDGISVEDILEESKPSMEEDEEEEDKEELNY